MSTSKKLKSEQLFVRVETVMHDLQISRPFLCLLKQVSLFSESSRAF